MYYFAYGSNMCTARLARRVPTVTPVGPAWLDGHQLRWHLVGGDGSAKCNVWHTGDPQDRVHGVLFQLDESRLDQLHAAEGPAYDYLKLTVGRPSGESVTAATYRGRAEWLEDGLTPFVWYHHFVVSGAREHGLPAEWISRLQAVATCADPDSERARQNAVIAEETPDNIVD